MLRVRGDLDFESRREYAITLSVADSSGLTDEATVYIDILDANDLFIDARTVHTVDGALSTLGGDVVTFNGTNFGWAPSASTYTPSISNTSVRVNATYSNGIDGIVCVVSPSLVSARAVRDANADRVL